MSRIEMTAVRPVMVVMAVLGLGIGAPARAAGDVDLRIGNGRVWLTATDATVGHIMHEWARVGATEVVNGDRVTDRLMTLQLSGVSEQEALDILLRPAAGFVAVLRSAPTGSESRFGRISILPAGSASPAAPPPTPAARQAAPIFPPPAQPAVPAPRDPGVERVIGPDGLPVPDDQEDAPGSPPPRQPRPE